MINIEALSWNPICLVTWYIFTLKIINVKITDDCIKAIKEILQTKPYDDYFLKNVLCKIYNGLDLLVVPDNMQFNVTKHIHKHGHFAHKHWKVAIKEQFFISNLSAKIDKVLSNCVTCILYNISMENKKANYIPCLKTYYYL